MAKNIGHLQHIKSNVVENEQPKLPLASVLVEGELAVNYAKDYETISLKNSDGEVIRFSSDKYYTEQKLGSGFTGANSANTVTSVIRDNELVVSSALNDLESRKLDASAYTPTDLSNYYTKSETSGATEISDALSDLDTAISELSGTVDELSDAIEEKADESWVEEKLGSAFTGVNSAVTVTEYVEGNELVISSALNDLETRKLDASAYTPTDLSNYYTKSETSGASEIEDALTELSDAFDAKLGSGFTSENSANTVTKVIEDNELVISSALNDLEERKMDASAYTPTDLSNYYTKQETYNKTEVDTAISNVDISDQLSAYTEVSAFTEYSAATEERMDDNELATAEAINNLYYRIEDFISAYTPTDFSNYYTKQETSGSSEISAALSEKEDTLAIDSTAKASSFNAEIGKYYFVNVQDNGSVTVTLPTSNVSSTNVQNIIFLVTLGSGTSSITFTPIAFNSEGFNNMIAGNTYEVNALWNGNGWIMAMTKLESVQ